MKADNILQTIGNTAHVRVNRLFGATHQVWIKSERSNPGDSIKDRIALTMVEPVTSPVLSGGTPASHPIQGIGAGFIPTNLNKERLDGVIQVDAGPARERVRRCVREEGLLVAIPSGATPAAIAQKLPDLPTGAMALGFNYDSGERYLSVEDFLPA